MQYTCKVNIPTCLSGVFRYRSKKKPIRLSRVSDVSSGYNNCARRGSSSISSISLQDWGLFFVAHICSALYRVPSYKHKEYTNIMQQLKHTFSINPSTTDLSHPLDSCLHGLGTAQRFSLSFLLSFLI